MKHWTPLLRTRSSVSFCHQKCNSPCYKATPQALLSKHYYMLKVPSISNNVACGERIIFMPAPLYRALKFLQQKSRVYQNLYICLPKPVCFNFWLVLKWSCIWTWWSSKIPSNWTIPCHSIPFHSIPSHPILQGRNFLHLCTLSRRVRWMSSVSQGPCVSLPQW